MFIHLTIELYGARRDIRIDSEQRIGEGVNILRENGKLPAGPSPDAYRSRMNQKLVSAYRTFAEERIFDGDVLTAIEE